MTVSAASAPLPVDDIENEARRKLREIAVPPVVLMALDVMVAVPLFTPRECVLSLANGDDAGLSPVPELPV